MNSSSVQQTCSITSNDTYTIDISSIEMDTITLSGSYNSGSGFSSMTSGGLYTGGGVGGSSGTINISGAGASGSTYTIGAVGAGGLTGITAQDISTFNWNLNEEFVNCLPDLERVKKMCEEYPGLKIAYEKFVTTYKLVRDDYDTPKDKRPKP